MNKFRRWVAMIALSVVIAFPAGAPIAARADDSGLGVALVLGGLYFLGKGDHHNNSRDCDYDTFSRNRAPAHYDTFSRERAPAHYDTFRSEGNSYQYDSYSVRPSQPAYDEYGQSYNGGAHYDTFSRNRAPAHYDTFRTNANYSYGGYDTYGGAYGGYAPPQPVAPAVSPRALATDRFRYYTQGQVDQFHVDQEWRVAEERGDAEYLSPGQEAVHATRVKRHLTEERQAFAAQQAQQQQQFNQDFDGCP